VPKSRTRFVPSSLKPWEEGPLVEIIPGKGSGQLKKRVLRFLDQKEIKARYHRVEKDRDNFGRVFVHFRWK
jgi:DNA-nicking Smr family endonuclease